MSQELTASDSAALLQISERQFFRLVERGLPRHKRGRSVFYLAHEVVQWRIRESVEAALLNACPAERTTKAALREALIRKTAADAARAELKFQREKGAVVDVADIQSAIAQTFTNVRNRLLALPRGLASRLCGESRVMIEEILDTHIRTVLELLGDHAADPPEELAEAAPETQAQSAF